MSGQEIIVFLFGVLIGGLSIFVTVFIYINKEIRQITQIISTLAAVKEEINELYEHKEKSEPIIFKLEDKINVLEKRIGGIDMDKNKILEIEKMLIKITANLEKIDNKLNDHAIIINEIKNNLKEISSELMNHATWIKIQDAKQKK